MNRHRTTSEKPRQGNEWISRGSDGHQALGNGIENAIGNFENIENTQANAPLGRETDRNTSADVFTCASMRSKTHSSASNRASIRESNVRNTGMNCVKLNSENSIINLGQSGNLHPSHQPLNANNVETEIARNSADVNTIQGDLLNVRINGNANAGHNENGLVTGPAQAAPQHSVAQHAEDIDPNIPAWASATPVLGYIMHPVAGLVMHPSFYDNRHLIEFSTQPRYIYDGEVDGPLCPVGMKCDHVKNCFEVRVRMAVFAYQRHHISFRDAEYIWSVSRSTIQRRKAAMEKQSPIIFLITPENTGE